jgi:excinuclease ABC subunit B
MVEFKLKSSMNPKGDQPKAIDELTQAVLYNKRPKTLLGVTGSGKTFTMAHVIANIKRPTLVISHNKTLAAQLYSEFCEFFPENAVEYFVSYYDYYQPEAYVPQTDTYIEKDASINEEIDKLRLSTTSSLMAREDVIVVASVSCIYNLGSPDDYRELLVFLEKGKKVSRDEILKKLVGIQYLRNDFELERGRFRVRGDVIDIFPAYKSTIYRVELFGDGIERIREIDKVSGKHINEIDKVGIYPAKHFVTTEDRIKGAVGLIKEELRDRLEYFRNNNKLLEAQRLEMRTNYDIEMLEELGYCNGVENYSRLLAGRPPGSRPSCLIDYFPKDFVTIIDESHVTLPQLRGMYWGDRSRKETLVEYGFRLPSALDNRPLQFEEFREAVRETIFVSATPSAYELDNSETVVEQIIRPTGLVDPEMIIKRTEGQIDDLTGEIKKRSEKGERVLVTTLTKRMAEDLSMYLSETGIKVKYLHSEIDVLERVEILRDLRLKKFDCLVGVNLLREGLDLPEVSLVAVLDADKEGFLRSQTSLIQVAGRAARNVNGSVIMYADVITDSMDRAIKVSGRRRQIQLEYNEKNNITPKSVTKAVKEGVESYRKAKEFIQTIADESEEEHDVHNLVAELQRDMETAARNLQFEKAIILRDQITKLKKAYNI